MTYRRKLLLAAIIGVGSCAIIIAVVLLFTPIIRPHRTNSTLIHGDRIALHSGFSVVVPRGWTSNLQVWSSTAAAKKVHEAFESLTMISRTVSPNLVAVATYAAGSNPWSSIPIPGDVALTAQHGAVQVRWVRPQKGIFNLWIITRFPNRFEGVIECSAPSVTSGATAVAMATRIVRLISANEIILANQ